MSLNVGAQKAPSFGGRANNLLSSTEHCTPPFNLYDRQFSLSLY